MAETFDLTDIVTEVMRLLPQWIRADLAAKDGSLRERAEDALAAMIANAVAEAQTVTVSAPRRH